jgi:Arc/MetJ family transcription regulator
VRETVGETVRETVRETVGETVRETVRETVGDTVRETQYLAELRHPGAPRLTGEVTAAAVQHAVTHHHLRPAPHTTANPQRRSWSCIANRTRGAR